MEKQDFLIPAVKLARMANQLNPMDEIPGWIHKANRVKPQKFWQRIFYFFLRKWIDAEISHAEHIILLNFIQILIGDKIINKDWHVNYNADMTNEEFEKYWSEKCE